MSNWLTPKKPCGCRVSCPCPPPDVEDSAGLVDDRDDGPEFDKYAASDRALDDAAFAAR